VDVSRLLIIPAAGRGSRLRSDLPKPLVTVAGRTMLDRLADLYAPFVDRVVVIANPDSRPAIGAWARQRGASVEVQPSPTGMLDAILLAAPAIEAAKPAAIWITWADQVGVLPPTLERLAAAERAQPHPAMIVPTVRTRDPYIHFTRDRDGRIAGLLQRREGDAMPAHGEGDIGLFALTRTAFEQDLAAFAREATTGAGTGERNFVPFVAWLAQRRTVITIPCTDAREAIGVNTAGDLQAVESWLLARNGQ
jgi:bifunctional N-acetylglucosamine-1-phosphate-uridyltransferase/glucosamine-1-phosphate-acetyltransferase GlmU-like protein